MRHPFRCTITVLSKRFSVDTLNGTILFANAPETDINTSLRTSIPVNVWSRVCHAGRKFEGRSQKTTEGHSL